MATMKPLACQSVRCRPQRAAWPAAQQHEGEDAEGTMLADGPGGAPAPRFHHVGIETADLDNAIAWYGAFLGARPSWELETFSPLTRSRLPGIRRLVELVAGDLRLHLFER